MAELHLQLRELIESGRLAHVCTVNPDGSPQVSVVWIGLDGNEVVSGHMHRGQKVRNIERESRVVISLEAPRDRSAFLNPYAVLYTTARVEPTDRAWDLLDRLAKVYLAPDAVFPAPKGPGFVVRYAVDRVGGVGPWAD